MDGDGGAETGHVMTHHVGGKRHGFIAEKPAGEEVIMFFGSEGCEGCLGFGHYLKVYE